MNANKTPICTRETALFIIGAANNPARLAKRIDALARYAPAGSDWRRYALDFAAFLKTGNAPFSILAADGNKKLSFLAFSSLALASCPGAGACKTTCYSLKAWRYPAAFFRQLQNYRLLRTNSGRAQIREAFAEHKTRARKLGKSRVDFRLYVDGDFSSAADVRFWFDLLRANPWLQAYGYSKSFKQILAAGNSAPANYQLNISSGHNSGAATVARIEAYAAARGNFIAVDTTRVYKYSEMTSKAYRAEIRQASRAQGINRVFPCPGNCDACTPQGHACGRPDFKGVTIAVQMH